MFKEYEHKSNVNVDLRRLDPIFGDRLLVKQLRVEDKIGRFYIPDVTKDKMDKGKTGVWRAEVVRLGKKVDFEDLGTEVRVGDIVHVQRVASECPKFEEKDENGDVKDIYVLILDDDLLAVEG